MLREAAPDVLIVTTMDSTHHEFIIKGLKAGMHVITEKPMTTDEVKVQAILDAEKVYLQIKTWKFRILMRMMKTCCLRKTLK
jgi:predicted dehydrogenase